jgi:hypothetical protein
MKLDPKRKLSSQGEKSNPNRIRTADPFSVVWKVLRKFCDVLHIGVNSRRSWEYAVFVFKMPMLFRYCL